MYSMGFQRRVPSSTQVMGVSGALRFATSLMGRGLMGVLHMLMTTSIGRPDFLALAACAGVMKGFWALPSTVNEAMLSP